VSSSSKLRSFGRSIRKKKAFKVYRYGVSQDPSMIKLEPHKISQKYKSSDFSNVPLIE